MFILDMTIGMAGGCNEPPCVGIEGEKKEVVEKKPSKSDKWGGAQVTINPFPKVSESLRQLLNQKLLAAGLTEKELDFNNLSPSEKSDKGVPISQYLKGGYSLGRAKKADQQHVSSDPALDFWKEQQLQRLMTEQLERYLEANKESQELERVFQAMMGGSYNPKGSISALGNLLGSLTFASAKQLAGSSISDIADWASRRALRVAKGDPNSNEAKEILSILKGIVANCLMQAQGCCSEDSPVDPDSWDFETGANSINPGGTVPFEESAGSGQEISSDEENIPATSEEPKVSDETTPSEDNDDGTDVGSGMRAGQICISDDDGEHVDDITVLEDCDDEEFYEDSCEESCYATRIANDEIREVETPVNNAAYETDQVHAEQKSQNKEKVTVADELQKIQAQISKLQAEKNPDLLLINSLKNQEVVLQRNLEKTINLIA